MECPICLNSLTSRGLFKKKILNSPCCNQNIHEKCLKRWLRENNTCPLCRENLELVSVGSESKYCCKITKMQLARLTVSFTSLIFFFIIILFANEYRIFATILFILIILLIIIFVIKSILNISLRFTDDDEFINITVRQVIVHNTN